MGNTETDCQAVLEHLYAFLDEELGEDECVRIQAHLEACPECFNNADFERAVKDLVHRKCRETSLPAGLADRLRAKLRGR